ncbi:MAG: GNAT family N-acetyltransferase [Pseudomonadota bacterium]
MELETRQLRIRYFRDDDLHQYARIVADPDVMKFVGGPQSTEDARDYLCEMIELSQTRGLGRYAVELKDNGILIGFCGFRPTGSYIDFGYRYAKNTWGRGIGIEAAVAVREYGLQVLGMHNMEAGAAIENVASIKILDRLNFKLREEVIFDGLPAIRYRDAEIPDAV